MSRRRGRRTTDPAAGTNSATRLVVHGVEPDVEVRAERFRDLLAEERADGAAVDAPHELTLEVPLGDRVVPDRGPGLPPRRLLGQVRADLVPLVQVRRRERRVETRQPGAVTHHVAHEHAVFAARRELGPVLRDRRVEVEHAPVGEHQHAERRHGLRARVDVDDRVLDPRIAVGVRDAAPQVDDRLAVDRQRDARTHFESRVEVAFERAADRFETRLTHTVGVHVPTVGASPHRGERRGYAACRRAVVAQSVTSRATSRVRATGRT